LQGPAGHLALFSVARRTRHAAGQSQHGKADGCVYEKDAARASSIAVCVLCESFLDANLDQCGRCADGLQSAHQGRFLLWMGHLQSASILISGSAACPPVVPIALLSYRRLFRGRQEGWLGYRIDLVENRCVQHDIFRSCFPPTVAGHPRVSQPRMPCTCTWNDFLDTEFWKSAVSKALAVMAVVMLHGCTPQVSSDRRFEVGCIAVANSSSITCSHAHARTLTACPFTEVVCSFGSFAFGKHGVGDSAEVSQGA
jgi:hypothetical protein